MIEPENMAAMSAAGDTNPSGNAAPLSETNSPPIEEKDPEKLNLFHDNNTLEPEDMATMSSAGDANPSGNAAPISETNSPPIEEKDPEKLNLFHDNNNTSESTLTQTPKEDTGNSISFSEDSIDHSQSKDQNGSVEQEERTMGAAGRISPVVETSDVDAVCSNKPDIDVGTSATSINSQRIEPEGTTPVVPRANMQFDDDMLDNVLSESRERQEERERTNRARMPRIESEDAMATQEENVKNADGNNQNDLKKKPKEPPGTPVKHERQTSETADEWQQRMKETNKRHQRELSLIDEKRVDQMLVDEGEEKKGDDETSIQRDPSGSSISLNKLPRDTWDKNSYQGKQPTKIFQDEEKAKEISTSEVEKAEKRYESPTRRSQQHGLDFNNTHIVHANSHAFNQPQTYNEIIRQTPNTLSPSNFLEDDESIPIPHLPPLMVPGIGASYNSLSSVQGQQVHLNHNGYQQQYHQLPSLLSQQQQHPILPIPNHVTTMPGGKRKIHLQLWEDVGSKIQPETSGFLSFRRKKGILRRSPQQSSPISELGGSNHNRSNDNNGSDNNSSDNNRWADRGTLAVSWYEGTNSLELQEHVQNSVIRKLGLINTTKLLDFRVLDESSDPPEGMCYDFI
jgi:predicted DNA-binding WGR domain protein